MAPAVCAEGREGDSRLAQLSWETGGREAVVGQHVLHPYLQNCQKIVEGVGDVGLAGSSAAFLALFDFALLLLLFSGPVQSTPVYLHVSNFSIS